MLAFIDTNIEIYAVGGTHELRAPCIEILRLAAESPVSFFTDSEVLQEILHRFSLLRRRTDGRANMLQFAELMRGRIVDAWAMDVLRAGDLLIQHPRLSSRDCVHLAVMERVGCTTVVTADRGFETVPGMRRLHPADVSHWWTELGL